MNATKKMENLTAEEQAQFEQAQALIANLRKKNKAVVSCRIHKTQKGGVGFILNGLGIGKFFYKEHARALLADTEDGYAMRQKVLAWIEENEVELTAKPE